MTRNISIDTLRGLACLLLVAFHVVGSDASTGLRIDANHPLSQINHVLAYLRMPLFSFLSGFVYAARPYSGEPLNFFRGKARRLLVPMLLAGTFFAVLQALTPGANGGNYDWRLLHILPVAHFWFLESLFIIFLLIAALEHLGLLSTPSRFAAVWVLAALLFLFNRLPDYFGLAGAGNLLPFFLLGVGCKRFGYKLQRNHVILLAVALLGWCIYLLLTLQALPAGRSLAALLLGGGACVALLRSNVQLRWLARIGYFSFAIYLFHSMFTAASRIVLMRLLGVEAVAVLFFSGLVAGLLGPVVARAVLLKLPLGNWVLGETGKRQRCAETKEPASGSPAASHKASLP